MPKKPTSPWGHLVFGKDGSVRRETFRLPDAKEEQEAAAMGRFVHLHNTTWPTPHIQELRQLRGADNDFEADLAGETVLLELTEVVQRNFMEFVRPESLKSALAKRTGDIEIHHGVDMTGIVDVSARNGALTQAISAKIAKCYSKPNGAQFWLVIFSTAHLPTEFIRAGVLHISPGLSFARSFLRSNGSGVFDQIWYTDLETRPVRVWPEPVEKLS